MKQQYKFCKAIMVLLSVVALRAGAQPLSGVYTINDGLATGNGNFASFTDFATAITGGGVSGAVTVNVVPNTGPYVEQINLTNISGISQSNNVVINGNNNLITYNSSSFSAPWTFGMGGADYITIDNLNIEATGSGYAHALHLFNGANFNTFTNCTFSVTPNGDGGYYQIPVVVSGGTNWYDNGNSGNFNTWSDCQMFGGYACMTFNGPYNPPYDGNNLVRNCSLEDFVYYGLISYYQWNQTFQGNHIHRPTRTLYLYDPYAMDLEMTMGTVVEGNRINDLFVTNPSNYSYATGIFMYNYISPMPSGATRNIIRNNIIDNIQTNSDIYAMQLYYPGADVYHNTISLDQTNALSGYTYGVYLYNSLTGMDGDFKNNIISITKGGSDDHYGFYFNGVTQPSNYNDIYVNSSGGNNYVGYGTSIANTLAQWQSQGMDQQGTAANPTFSNIAAGDLHPTNNSMNNLGTPLGLFIDYSGQIRNMSTPDMGALEFNTPNCTGVPSMTSIAGPTYSICPGESVSLALGNFIAANGFTYLWQSSTVSPVGPFTNTLGTTFSVSVPSVTQTTYYTVVMTCTLPNGGAASPVTVVNVAGPTTTVVPYLETFENIGRNNRLPNCSWLAPNIGGTANTFTAAQSGNRLPKSGNSFATFVNSQPVNYYYTNGIFLQPNITYSAAVWYMTDFSGGTNWSNLSLQLGTSQTPTSMVTIASTTGPAVSPIYKLLSNTFTVGTAGMYYVAVKASATSGSATYLSWDDLSITIPCQVAPNSPTLTLNVATTTVCAKAPMTMNANGASTYTWNTGAVTAGITTTPQITSVYAVTGTNTLTGCATTSTILITVKDAPDISVSANPNISCAGKMVSFVASGASTYTWSGGGGVTGPTFTAAPLTSTSYTVIGTNTNNCNGVTVVQVPVNPNPTITVNAPFTICAGESATLSATGADNYKFVASNYYNTANPAVVTPGGMTTYSVEGADAFGCSSVKVVTVNVDPCTSVMGQNAELNKVYPNPTSSKLTIESVTEMFSVVMTDITGRTIAEAKGEHGVMEIDMSAFPAGVYLLTVNSNGRNVYRIIKD